MASRQAGKGLSILQVNENPEVVWEKLLIKSKSLPSCSKAVSLTVPHEEASLRKAGVCWCCLASVERAVEGGLLMLGK